MLIMNRTGKIHLTHDSIKFDFHLVHDSIRSNSIEMNTVLL